MTLWQFRRRVALAFGPQMEHATPANVREFLDALARERWQQEKKTQALLSADPEAPLLLSSGGPATYESILREFFARALDAPGDEALIQLWIFALDMAYSGVEEQSANQIGRLFEDRPREGQIPDHD